MQLLMKWGWESLRGDNLAQGFLIVNQGGNFFKEIWGAKSFCPGQMANSGVKNEEMANFARYFSESRMANLARDTLQTPSGQSGGDNLGHPSPQVGLAPPENSACFPECY